MGGLIPVLAAVLCLLDFACSLTFLLVFQFDDDNFFASYDITESVVDLVLINMIRSTVLCMTSVLISRSVWQSRRVSVRMLTLLLPLATVAFAVFKCAELDYDSVGGPTGFAVSLATVSVLMPMAEAAMLYYVCFHDEDSSLTADERAPLMTRKSFSAVRAHRTLPGVMTESSPARERGPVTVAAVHLGQSTLPRAGRRGSGNIASRPQRGSGIALEPAPARPRPAARSSPLVVVRTADQASSVDSAAAAMPAAAGEGGRGRSQSGARLGSASSASAASAASTLASARDPAADGGSGSSSSDSCDEVDALEAAVAAPRSAKAASSGAADAGNFFSRLLKPVTNVARALGAGGSSSPLLEAGEPSDSDRAAARRLKKERRRAKKKEKQGSKEMMELFKKRTHIFDEIISTEESYEKQLKMIIEVFLNPLRRAADAYQSSNSAAGNGIDYVIGIERPQVKTIFLELESISQLSSAMLHSLRDRRKSWAPDTKVAGVFLELIEFMKIYPAFASNFEHALETIAACKRNTGFNRFLCECIRKPQCGKMWLEDHLIIPVQRVPRYLLLLRELRKRTPQSHPDSADLDTAIAKVENLASQMNEAKKKVEKSLMMINIQRMIKHSPMLVTPTREFINDFPCVEMKLVAAPSEQSSAQKTAWRLSESSADTEPEEPHPEMPTADTFVVSRDVVLYLFNDTLLEAAHAHVEGVLGRTQEGLKKLARSANNDVFRPVIANERGGETLHKFKYQTSSVLNKIRAQEEARAGLTHGFSLQWDTTTTKFYDSPSLSERQLFLDTFRAAQESFQKDSEYMIVGDTSV
eukprot:m.216372 g.216372  ORF g.216372 m.216372 type:complete len:813 (+) comp22215_c0_seq1:195-2633(+)